MPIRYKKQCEQHDFNEHGEKFGIAAWQIVKNRLHEKQHYNTNIMYKS